MTISFGLLSRVVGRATDFPRSPSAQKIGVKGGLLYTPRTFGGIMAYKYTSETFTIRSRVTETVANTYAEQTINLNLDSLSREILVIERVDLDPQVPDGIPGTLTAVNVSLANQTQTAVIFLDDPDTIAGAQNAIVSGAPGDSVAFSEQMPESINMSDSPLYIVATDNLFFGISGTGNVGLKSASMVVHARRARADAGTYAAILTSQFN